MLTVDELTQLKALLVQKRKIVLLAHKNPDGDAIGSTLALSSVLKKQGHDVQIIVPNDFPKFLKWLPNAKKVFNADFNIKGAEIAISKAQILFLLDFNEVSRIDQLASFVEKSAAKKVLIDHHQQPGDFDFVYSDTAMPATCEMVYHFIKQMNWEEFLDKEIAISLYAGMLTDTGNFKYPSVKASTLATASELIKLGAEPHKIYDALFDNNSISKFKLLSVFLNNIKVLPEYRTAIFYLTKEELLNNGYEKGDTDGFVNYGLSLNNIVFSVFMAEDTQRDFVKISFRSKGDFDTSEFSRNHFSGGGHINASGGKSDISIQDTIKEFVNLLPKYEEKLRNTKI